MPGSHQILLFVMMLALLGLSSWQFWRTHQEINSRGATDRRADQQAQYWTAVAFTIGIILLAVLSITAIALRLIPQPFHERASQYYPARASRENVTGFALIRCRVTATYGVSDCHTVSESPPGYGFGASALKVAALMTLPQKDRAQAHPGQWINIPIRFKLPDSSPAPTSKVPRRPVG